MIVMSLSDFDPITPDMQITSGRQSDEQNRLKEKDFVKVCYVNVIFRLVGFVRWSSRRGKNT